MENKIQELTDKIYREGVEKGNEEARQIRTETFCRSGCECFKIGNSHYGD